MSPECNVKHAIDLLPVSSGRVVKLMPSPKVSTLFKGVKWSLTLTNNPILPLRGQERNNALVSDYDSSGLFTHQGPTQAGGWLAHGKTSASPECCSSLMGKTDCKQLLPRHILSKHINTSYLESTASNLNMPRSASPNSLKTFNPNSLPHSVTALI